jgi:5'-nucleotidase
MVILLTNDDGYSADGIKTLFSVLSASHEVYMIAPASERSACSNAVTMRDFLEMKKISEREYSLSGFPADCVNAALHGTFLPEIDIVVSGINHGPNLGDDIHYSGTVAGARTSFINGKTGIAVSLCGQLSRNRFTDCAQFILDFITANEKALTLKPRLININYPDCNKDSIKGSGFCFLDKRHYIDRFIVTPVDAVTQRIKLEGIVTSDRIKGSDFDLISDNVIAITPLMIDATDYNFLKTGDGLILTSPAVKEWLEI